MKTVSIVLDSLSNAVDAVRRLMENTGCAWFQFEELPDGYAIRVKAEDRADLELAVLAEDASRIVE